MLMLTGKGLVDFCREKLGMPYFFGAKMEILTQALMATMHRMYPGTVTELYIKKARDRGMVGKVCVDCSGLIGAYRKKQIGSAQLHQTAKTRLSINEADKWADGVVCWRSGHVGVFAKEGGKKVVYEAKGIDYGVVKSDFIASKWSCGLTFDDIDYAYDETVANKTQRGKNPYAEPTVNLKIGAKDDMVKWLQWELVEAGYDIKIDGEFGPLTDTALRSFQRSCKIEVDGICGPNTRKYLKADVPEVSEDPANYTFGIDVAKWNGVIDWKKVFAAGKRFAVLKVTNKKNQTEEAFERNYKGCRENGIAIAVYRYVYATSLSQAEKEARAIVDTLRGKQIEGEVWLDMEEQLVSGIGPSALTLIIDQEAKILKGAGYKVGIYCNKDWYDHILDSRELSKRYKFWIAKCDSPDIGEWRNRKDNPKDIAVGWQYSFKGRVDGISGDVDLDLIY